MTLAGIETLVVNCSDAPALLQVFHEQSQNKLANARRTLHLTISRDRTTQQFDHASCRLKTRLRMSLEVRNLMGKHLTICILEGANAYVRKKRLTTSRSATNSFEAAGTSWNKLYRREKQWVPATFWPLWDGRSTNVNSTSLARHTRMIVLRSFGRSATQCYDGLPLVVC